MKDIAAWGFSWMPPVARGRVRDLRMHWAFAA